MRLPDQMARRLVELACLAPSVHNTQPWSWSVEDDHVCLLADFRRMLPVEDPDGRSLVISCGAALQHLQYAARALGFVPHVARLPDGGTELLADVRLSRREPSPTGDDELALLRRRCTDRRRFTSWPVPPEQVESLADAARAYGSLARPVTGTSARFRVGLLAERALAIQAADPAAVAEQRRWLDRNDRTGLPRAVLTEPDETAPPDRFASDPPANAPGLVERGDSVIVLGGATDDPASWLRTGEGLAALWLEATGAGLSVVPLSQPIEVAAVREELRDSVLLGAFLPHLLVRIGWQSIGRSDLPRSPRRAVEDVLLPGTKVLTTGGIGPCPGHAGPSTLDACGSQRA